MTVLAVQPAAPTAVTRRRRAVGPWLALLALAAVMAYADGFWLTSLQGALGAIERSQSPFSFWLRDSTLLLPVYAGAVLVALRLARRRYGPVLRGRRPVLVAGLLVTLAGTLVGAGWVAASSAYDYRLQSQQITLMHALHAHPAATVHLHPGALVTPVVVDGCDVACRERRSTRAVHLHGLELAAGLLAGTNLLLVGWVVAGQGGRLTVPGRLVGAG